MFQSEKALKGVLGDDGDGFNDWPIDFEF